MNQENLSTPLLHRIKIGGSAWLIIILLLLAGGIGFLVLKSYFRSRSFEPVSGVIIKSVMIPCESEVGGFHADIRFSYTVDRREYFDGRFRYDFGKMCERKETVQALIDQYPQGKKVDAWYDPNSPKMAVIDRSLGKPEKVFLAVMGGFLLFFLIVWRMQVANERRRHEIEQRRVKKVSTKE